jgi:hypothetical protein
MKEMIPEKPMLGEEDGIQPSRANRPGCPGPLNPRWDELGGIG